MTIQEAAELAQWTIYRATFCDGASGGVASGTSSRHKYFLDSVNGLDLFLVILFLTKLIC